MNENEKNQYEEYKRMLRICSDFIIKLVNESHIEKKLDALLNLCISLSALALSKIPEENFEKDKNNFIINLEEHIKIYKDINQDEKNKLH